MKKKITVAQIGCGYWGPNLVRNLVSNPLCDLKCVVEVSSERQAYLKQHFRDVRVSSNVEEVWNDKSIQAVVIATPAGTHFPLATQALAASKHLFVEKPLAMNYDDAYRLVNQAGLARKILMVGHTFLYHPAVHFMKSTLESGDLGKLYYVYSQRLNLGQVRTDVNAWWNLAPHDVSILLYLMDGILPAEISVTGTDYLQKGIEDVAFAGMSWADKTSAHVHVSWLDPHKTRRMVLVGEKKMLVYDDCREDKVAIYNKAFDKKPTGEGLDYDNPASYRLAPRSGDIVIPKIDFKEPLALEMTHFLECVQKGTRPITGPEQALATVAVLEAGEKSLRSKGRVSLHPFSISRVPTQELAA